MHLEFYDGDLPEYLSFVLSLKDLPLHAAYQRLASSELSVFPGYARLALYRANLHLGAGRLACAAGELREAILRCAVFPHDDMLKEHLWSWVTSETSSQCPPYDGRTLRNVMAAVFSGNTPLLSAGVPTQPWFQQPDPPRSDYTNLPYESVLGYTVTDPRRPYRIVWSAKGGLHAELTRSFSGVLSTYGLLGHVQRDQCPRQGALGRKRTARGDYTHLVAKDVSGDVLLDGKFAIPLDEMSGLGAFINGARSDAEATVSSEWLQLPYLRPDGTRASVWVMVMKTKRALSQSEPLLYKYSDCAQTATKTLLSHPTLQPVAPQICPHLDVCLFGLGLASSWLPWLT